jgi:hypothetical protein
MLYIDKILYTRRFKRSQSVDSGDEIVTGAFEKLGVLLGECSALIAGHGLNHLLLHFSSFDALVLHYQALHNDDRAQNHTTEDSIFECDPSPRTESQKSAGDSSSHDLVDSALFLPDTDEGTVCERE